MLTWKSSLERQSCANLVDSSRLVINHLVRFVRLPQMDSLRSAEPARGACSNEPPAEIICMAVRPVGMARLLAAGQTASEPGGLSGQRKEVTRGTCELRCLTLFCSNTT